MDKKTGITSRLSPSVHLLARHAVEGGGVFDLQIIATMLANGVHDGIDALSLASSPLCVVPLLRTRSLSDTMNPMSKTIETIYRNGRIELPADVHLPEDTRVTVILPDNATHGMPADPAYSIPDLASDIGPPDLARNLEHYLYGHPKQS
jgi:hypothetical protein